MLGRLCWGNGRRIRLRPECLFGLPMLTLEIPEQKCHSERTLKQCAGLLRSNQVNRVLAPPQFSGWTALQRSGVRPVETNLLRCALAPDWVAKSLSVKGIEAQQARVCLRGERLSVEMSQVARMLCPVVRNLIIDAPGGAQLAKELRREFGLPILLTSAETDFVLRFDSGPVLSGARITLKNREVPGEYEIFPLISILWETGKVKMEEILLHV